MNVSILNSPENTDAATEGFCKKKCSYKFRKFYRKTLVLESLFNKVEDLEACNFIKKRLQLRRFSVRFLRTPTLKNICKWLLSQTKKLFFTYIEPWHCSPQILCSLMDWLQYIYTVRFGFFQLMESLMYLQFYLKCGHLSTSYKKLVLILGAYKITQVYLSRRLDL